MPASPGAEPGARGSLRAAAATREGVGRALSVESEKRHGDAVAALADKRHSRQNHEINVFFYHII